DGSTGAWRSRSRAVSTLCITARTSDCGRGRRGLRSEATAAARDCHERGKKLSKASRGVALALAAAALVLTLAASGSAAPGGRGTYIVVLKNSAGPAAAIAAAQASRFGGDV